MSHLFFFLNKGGAILGWFFKLPPFFLGLWVGFSMEALPPLALGPPHVSNLGVVIRVCGRCVFFSSLKGKNGA
jgi:hypothetical protein